jgi:hypothetical protein
VNNIWHNNEERPKNGYYIAGLTCRKYSDNTEGWGFIIGDYGISGDGSEKVYEEETWTDYSKIIKWAYYEDFVNYIKSEIL